MLNVSLAVAVDRALPDMRRVDFIRRFFGRPACLHPAYALAGDVALLVGFTAMDAVAGTFTLGVKVAGQCDRSKDGCAFDLTPAPELGPPVPPPKQPKPPEGPRRSWDPRA
jgi:hypothetical protein